MLERLQQILRKYMDDENLVLTEDMVIRTELDINSFEFVQVFCDVEDAFGIEIPDRVIIGFKTVGDVVEYLREQ